MAIIPGKKNFKVERRADFPIKLTFKDSTGSAISLIGYTVAAQVYDESSQTTSGVRVHNCNNQGSSQTVDKNIVCVSIFGDQ